MPKAENGTGMGRAELERMSTASLEKMLLDDFYAPEQGTAGMDEVYMAAEILEGRGPVRPGSAERAWERFQENYLPFAAALAEDGGTPSPDGARGRRHTPFYRRPVRAALAAAILLALLLSVSAAAANGFDFLKTLARWTDEQMWLAPGQIRNGDKDDIHIPKEEREYAGPQEALADCGFTRPVIPRWLPEGFQLERVTLDNLIDKQLLCNAVYQRGEDSFVILVIIYLDEEDMADGDYTGFEKDEGDPVPYEAGGITHLLSANAGRLIAVWANGPAECAAGGDITMDELKQVIDSIYE